MWHLVSSAATFSGLRGRPRTHACESRRGRGACRGLWVGRSPGRRRLCRHTHHSPREVGSAPCCYQTVVGCPSCGRGSLLHLICRRMSGLRHDHTHRPFHRLVGRHGHRSSCCGRHLLGRQSRGLQNHGHRPVRSERRTEGCRSERRSCDLREGHHRIRHGSHHHRDLQSRRHGLRNHRHLRGIHDHGLGNHHRSRRHGSRPVRRSHHQGPWV